MRVATPGHLCRPLEAVVTSARLLIATVLGNRNGSDEKTADVAFATGLGAFAHVIAVFMRRMLGDSCNAGGEISG